MEPRLHMYGREIIFLGLLLFIHSTSLGQNNDVRLDSIYAYQFNSETDSFPQEKQICSYSSYENSSDCYNFSSCISSSWDWPSRTWIPFSKNTTRLEEEGKKRITMYYWWDQQNNDWQQRQRTFDLEEANVRETYNYEWDSLSNDWIHLNSFVFKFDDAGNQILFESKFNRREEGWEGIQERSTFDETGKRIEYINSTWDAENEVWLPQARYTESYSSHGHTQKRTSYSWNPETNMWHINSIEDFTYDSQGNEILWEKGFSQGPQGPWILDEKAEKIYDSQGNLVIDTYSRIDFNTGEWIVHDRTELSYNGLSQLIHKNIYGWDWQISQFRFMETDHFTYAANGKIAMEQRFFYDTAQVIANGNQIEYAYDQNDRETLRVYASWKKEENKWSLAQKTESPYDSQGRRIYYATYIWDEQQNQWIGRQKTGYNYSDSGTIHRIYKALWDLLGEDWVITTNRIFDYGPCHQENMLPAREGLFLVYPNPVSQSWLYLESELERPFRYEVLDMQGRKVLEGEMNAISNPLDIGQLSNGTYIIRCQAGDRWEAQKFVIARL